VLNDSYHCLHRESCCQQGRQWNGYRLLVHLLGGFRLLLGT
jgi:hypothetical protein